MANKEGHPAKKGAKDPDRSEMEAILRAAQRDMNGKGGHAPESASSLPAPSVEVAAPPLASEPVPDLIVSMSETPRMPQGETATEAPAAKPAGSEKSPFDAKDLAIRAQEVRDSVFGQVKELWGVSGDDLSENSPARRQFMERLDDKTRDDLAALFAISAAIKKAAENYERSQIPEEQERLEKRMNRFMNDLTSTLSEELTASGRKYVEAHSSSVETSAPSMAKKEDQKKGKIKRETHAWGAGLRVARERMTDSGNHVAAPPGSSTETAPGPKLQASELVAAASERAPEPAPEASPSKPTPPEKPPFDAKNFAVRADNVYTNLFDEMREVWGVGANDLPLAEFGSARRINTAIRKAAREYERDQRPEARARAEERMNRLMNELTGKARDDLMASARKYAEAHPRPVEPVTERPRRQRKSISGRQKTGTRSPPAIEVPLQEPSPPSEGIIEPETSSIVPSERAARSYSPEENPEMLVQASDSRAEWKKTMNQLLARYGQHGLEADGVSEGETLPIDSDFLSGKVEQPAPELLALNLSPAERAYFEVGYVEQEKERATIHEAREIDIRFLKGERARLIAAEQGVLVVEAKHYGTGPIARMRRRVSRFLGGDQERLAAESKMNYAAADYEIALRDRLQELLSKKGWSEEKSKKVAARYRRAFVARDVVERGEQLRIENQEKTLNARDRALYEKMIGHGAHGFNWMNAKLEKNLGPSGARAARVIASATVGTVGVAALGPGVATLGAGYVAWRITRGLAGSFGGAAVGAHAGHRYQKTLGASAARAHAEVRAGTFALTPEEMKRQRHAYRGGSAEAIAKKRVAVEMLTAMFAGAGISAGMQVIESLATIETVQNAATTLAEGQSQPNTPPAGIPLAEATHEQMTADASPEPAGAVPHFSVEASGGHGYEWMTKRLWEEMHDPSRSFDTGHVIPGSDMDRLMSADAKSIDGLVHRLATEHHFFHSDGTSVRIAAGTHLSFGADGQLSPDVHGSSIAPEHAPTTPPVHHDTLLDRSERAETARLNAAEVARVERANLEPNPRAAVELPAPRLEPERVGPPTPLTEQAPPAVHPSPIEGARGFQVNANGLRVDFAHAHDYIGQHGERIVFGGTTEERAKLAMEIVVRDHAATVYFDSSRPNALGVMTHHLSKVNWFEGTANEMQPTDRGFVVGKSLPMVEQPRIVDEGMDPSLRGARVPSIDDLQRPYTASERIP